MIVPEMDDGRREEHREYVERMKVRTKKLSLRVIEMFRALPKDEAANVLGKQVLRSATSVGANYRAACRVRTGKEFAAKLRIVCEETDETQYWLELLMESGIMRESKLRDLHTECTELLAMFSTALATTRQRLRKK